MSINKKIFIVLTLVLVSSLSGCALFNRTEFSLISAIVSDDSGFPSIVISFNTTDKITLTLTNPDSESIFSDIFYRGHHETVAYIEDYRNTPTPGTYSIKAYDKDNNLISEDDLVFEGQNLSIIGVDDHWWVDDDKFVFVGLTMTLTNPSDLPIYPWSVDVQIENNGLSGLVLPSVILPHKSERVDCFVFHDDISPGEKTIELTLKNKEGDEIGYYSSSTIPIENIPDLVFSWSYGGSNNLKLPDVEFLYEYYSSLDRFILEDYAAYIFDVFDDQYMDTVAQRLLSLTDVTEDVDKINFIAAFVQKLQYADDDENDSTCEYPRFPIEMLKDKQGDCEDKAMLAADILDIIGYNVSLLRLPNHMAVGVNLDENASAYDYYIDEYYFLETTGTRGYLGKVPDEYKDITNITVHPITNRAILIHNWKNATRLTGSDGSDFIKMRILVENLGRKTARNFEIRGAFHSENDIGFNQEIALIPFLVAGDKKIVDLMIDVPQSFTTTLKTKIYLNDEMVHEKESTDTFP